MTRISSNVSSRIYDVLIRYANVDPDKYQREGFIYQFSVFNHIPPKFELQCLDSKPRTFENIDNRYELKGEGEMMVNSVVKKLIEHEI